MNVLFRLKILLCLALACWSIVLVACKDPERQPVPVSVFTSQNLRFVAAYPLNVSEPSGLSLSRDRQSLWTVSDNSGKIYQLNLSGDILSSFQSERYDLEGITVIDANHLAFISERERKIVVARKIGGRVLQQAAIAIPGFDNKGPEALTYDQATEQFHILQEVPGTLITLNRQLEEVARRELKFAQDYSSMCFDSVKNQLWVLSDVSRSIHVLDADLRIQESFSLSVDQMEGLAVDHEAGRIYLVSDPLDTLFVLEYDSF